MGYQVKKLTNSDYIGVSKLDLKSGFCVREALQMENYSWGIFDGYNLIGYCVLADKRGYPEVIKKYNGWTDRSIMVSDVYILPEYRRQGLASMMLNKAISMRPKNDNHIFLTAETPKLQELYQKIGFKPIDDHNMVKVV